MPRLGTIKRDTFVQKLQALGFEGPFPGKRHEFLTYGSYPLHIPSDKEYSPELHADMLKEVRGILGRTLSRDEWLRL
jgi:hypothetical protein